MGEIEELLRRYHAVGDEAAIEEVVRRTRARLLRVARRIGAPQDAEDTVQSAYLALARKRGEPFDAPVVGWLVTAVVRIAYRRKAVESRQHELGSRLATERSAMSPAAQAIGAEERAALRRDIARLPAKYRDAIVLHHLEGLTMAEVGRLQGLPEATVRTRVRRGRALLAGRLQFLFHGMLVLPWLLQDAVRPLTAGGTIMNKKSLVAGALLLIAVGAVMIRQHAIDTPVRTVDGHPVAAAVPPSPGDAAAAGNPVASSEEARVTGVVVGPEGRPVAGALVSTGEARQRSDPAGRFTLAVAGAPYHRLRVDAEEHAPTLVEPVRAGDDVVVTLDSMSTLSGVVADLDRNPIAGARVTWCVQGDGVRIERSARTGERGAFRITGLPSPCDPLLLALGHNVPAIRVEAEGFFELLTVAELPAARTGRDLRQDLYLGRGATLRGRVLAGDSGRPLAGVQVELGSIPGAPQAYRYGAETTGPDGTFEMTGVACDAVQYVVSYGGGSDRKLAVLRAACPGYAVATDDVSVAREGEVVEVELTCWPSGIVRGRVVDRRGRPVGGAGVEAVSLVQTQRAMMDPGGSRVSATSDARGRYEFAVPGPGPVRITASSAGRPETVVEASVRPGATVDAPELVLGKQRPAVVVEVVDAAGEPVWGALVSLRGSYDRTARDGRVSLFGIAGAEMVATASSIDAGRAASAPFVPGSQAGVVRIVLDATHTIRGTVLLANGTPAAGARVDAGGATSVANRNGRFELRRLAAGAHRVSARGWDRAGESVTCHLDAVGAGSDAVVLTLPAFPEREGTTVEIEGTVRDRRTNAPVSTFEAVLGGNGRRWLRAERTPHGRFRIAGVSPGRWSLRVTAPGYESHDAPVEVRADARDVSVDVVLAEGNRLTGRVAVPERKAATFTLERDDGERIGMLQIGADGRYALENVPPGRYRPLVLVPPELAAARDAVVVVEPGTRRARFDFRLERGGWIAATLPEDAREIRYLGADGRRVWARTGLDGSVAAKLPAGRYLVRLTLGDGATLERACGVPGSVAFR